MYIEPNSNIKIYKNVPLDNTYNHTLYFSSLSEQNAYFHGSSSILKYNLTSQSYQRVVKGSMRVEIKADNLYDCNYIAFQNTNFGNKWFYAFITSVEYVNNVTSEITFEIDVMQTYLFDVTLKMSFVEREHSSTDVAGDNIVNENLDVGDYFYGLRIRSGLFNDYTIAMYYPYEMVGSTATKKYKPQVICNNPSAISGIYFKGNTVDEALNSLEAVLFSLDQQGFSSDIASIYCIPSSFVNSTETIWNYLPSDVVEIDVTYASNKPITLGNYTPRNKKLLTYPYNMFVITTFDGDEKNYAYEYFSSDDITFKIQGNLTSNPSFKAVPTHYKGLNNNIAEGVVLSDLPLVPYTYNAYSQWYAQNKTRLGLQGLSGIAGGYNGIGEITRGMNMVTPKTHVISSKGAKHIGKGVSNIVESGASTLLSGVTECISARTLGSKPVGSTDGSLEIATGTKDFSYMQKHINEKYAEILDDYFDMFGYATRRIKIPNRNVRPHWTYTKTIGCNLQGNAPVDDVEKICSIYDNGITFWNNPSEVGDYSLDNTLA